jgi:hypothetical protein
MGLVQSIKNPLQLKSNLCQAFKYLEDRDTCDGGDSLYCCLWDMAVLEFAMSLHTRYLLPYADGSSYNYARNCNPLT